MKTKVSLWTMTVMLAASSAAFCGTVTGTLQTPNGQAIKNATLDFNLEQAGLLAGSGSIVPVTASCYTSADGSVVGLPNPLSGPVATADTGAGSLAGGIYYVETTFYSASLGGGETLPSPELRIQLSSTGSLLVNSPVPFPAGAAGMRVYIGSASGGETLQGQTSGTTQFAQTSALIAGTTAPAANSTACSVDFNDTIIPYSGYKVSLVSSSGNAYPGWPQSWQLNGGTNGLVNLSEGAPLWSGVIVYPQPLVAQPLNHGPQSISGSLNLSGFNAIGAGAVGVGTSTPSWPLDVENGAVNASGGYLYNGGAGTAGECLVSNGTTFVPGTCFTPGAVFYQTLKSNGSAQAQESAANFSSRFALGDNAGAQRTEIDLASSGVAAGSYTNADITVNSFGQVTAASNGRSVPVIQSLLITSGICSTTSGSAFSQCTFGPVSWPSGGFADSNYAVTCQGMSPPTPGVTGLFVSNKTASGINLTIQNGDANGAIAATFTEIDCVGVHP